MRGQNGVGQMLLAWRMAVKWLAGRTDLLRVVVEGGAVSGAVIGLWSPLTGHNVLLRNHL
jgi:hypothetical protein